MNTAVNLSKFFIEDLRGTVNRQDWDKTPPESCLVSKNVIHDNVGTWKTRAGIELKAATQTGWGVQGLAEYMSPSKLRYIKAIRSGDLDQYDPGGNNYIQEESTVYTLGEKVSQVQFLEKTYSISLSTFLRYNTNGATTIVGSDTDRITGETLSVAQGTLFVGTGSRIYYSDFNGATNMPTDKLWKFDESGLVASTNFLTLSKPHTAQFSYGITGLNYIFTEDACYVFDINYAENNAVSKVFDIGCAGLRAIGLVNNSMVWMSPDGRIWVWGGSNEPRNISFAIEDDSNGESLISVINKSTIQDVAFGSDGNNFWFSVGDINIYNKSIPRACIYGFALPQFKDVYWGIHQFPVKPTIFCKTKINGENVLLFGADGVDDIYQMQVGTNDEGIAIESFIITKFFQFGDVFTQQKPVSLVLKFRPKQVADCYLVTSYAIDSTNDYSVFSDPLNNNSTHGVINMFNQNSKKRSDRRKIGFPENARGRSLSIEFSNSVLDQGFEIQGFGFEINLSKLDITIKST